MKGTAIETDSDTSARDHWPTAPICGIPLTAFQSCILKLNNVVVDGTEGNFHFNAYLENQLGLSQQAKDNHHSRTAIWFEDTPRAYGTKKSGADMFLKNEGFEGRLQLIDHQNATNTFTKLPLSISKTKKLCVPGVTMEILLNHNPDTLRLMCEKKDSVEPRLVFEKLYLRVTRYHLSNELYLAINAKLAAGAVAKYQVKIALVTLHCFLIRYYSLCEQYAWVLNKFRPARRRSI